MSNYILSATEYDLKQFLQMTMFLLSNKLSINGQGQIIDQGRCIIEEDHLILKLIDILGWSDVDVFKRLQSSGQPLAQAILERLFQSAIRLRALNTVNMLLQA